jgi:hypothetical protein
VIQAFRLAVNDSFRLATVFCVAGLAVAAMMRTRPLRSSVHAGEATAPADLLVADL